MADSWVSSNVREIRFWFTALVPYAFHMRGKRHAPHPMPASLPAMPHRRCRGAVRDRPGVGGRGGGTVRHPDNAANRPMPSRCVGKIPVPPSGISEGAPGFAARIESRSEEHTSELQSLMRISYAVFCLKKKKHKE